MKPSAKILTARRSSQQPPLPYELWLEHRSLLSVAVKEWLGAEHDGDQHKEAAAQASCAEVVKTLWDLRTQKDRRWLTGWQRKKVSLPLPIRRLAREAAKSLEHFSEIEASYLIGTLYTALLPARLRASRGAYYTPPILAERLLDLVAAEGVDWSTVRALDPACGGGAFLAPLAHRILNDHRIQCLTPEERLGELEKRLAGVEIDPFAAWLSQVFLQLLAYPISRAADRALTVPVVEANALELLPEDHRRFDLIIGNPPFGRIGLSQDQRRLFSRSLYGHANLYGVFLDAALRWRHRDGLVAFVTPTSFLGGQYFSKLRSLLLAEAPPLCVDFIEARKGIFDSVLQETCLTVFGPSPIRATVVHLLEVSARKVKTTRAGTFPIDSTAGSPWLLPRASNQSLLIRKASTMPTRLHHLGYKASTGPLVWNRHRSQLRSRRSRKSYPLIWAEAVRPNELSFDYRSRASAPFVTVEEGQDYLLCSQPCVLVQRTTAKEQHRRLVACAVPADFLKQWGGIVVENHVNVLRPAKPDAVSPEALAAILNTEIVDRVFRCLSGSVAVSATEIHALPLPDPKVFRSAEAISTQVTDRLELQEVIETTIVRAYDEAKS